MQAVKTISIVVTLWVLLCSASPLYAATKYNVGISTSSTLLRMNDTDLDRRLNDIEHLGATWIRVDFSWPVIQPDNPNVYHWEMHDRVVRAAGAHHLKVLAILGYTPAWAQEPRCARLVITKAAGTRCNPRTSKMFGRFARAAAIHYKGQAIRAWEIWNEPNLSSYWKTAQKGSNAVHADVDSYAVFADAAALQLRLNDPGTLIVTGGLGPLFEPKYPKGLRQSDFLAQLLPQLNPSLFDGVGIHPYSWPLSPDEPAIYNAFYTVDHGAPQYNLRLIMDKAGWGDKQLWATEFGASTKGLHAVSQPTRTARPDHVNEAAQAQIITQGIQDWDAKPNAGPLFIHSDSDQWLPQHKNEGGFGLRRNDGSEKPSYTAIKSVIR